jgi:glycosyltransferase involved in cell wall biosynthesis
MRILADLRCLQDARFASRGIGSHASFLLHSIRARGADQVELIGLIDGRRPLPPKGDIAVCDALRSAFVRDDRHTPTVFLQLSPMTHDGTTTGQLLDRSNILPAAVVYDFVPLESPARYLSERQSLLTYAAAFRWLQAYRAFFPISHCTAAALRDRLGVEHRQMTVTGVAIRETLLAAEGAAVGPPAAASREFIFFVGGPDPRKNLDVVIEAHQQLVAAGRSDLQLVVAGRYPADWQRRVLQRHARHTRDDSGVLFLDHVSDTELAAWYAHARATVIASTAEGFSMPVVEAIACGGLAIVSDIEPHRELVPLAEARFRADEASDLAATLETLLTERSIRDGLAAAQRPLAEPYLTDAVGDRFWEGLLRHVGQLRRRLAVHPPSRPALAVVSPFPPDQSGVADYTRACVEALAPLADVDVYTDQRDPTPCQAVREFHPISAAAWLRPDYDAVVSVIGNSQFHTRIIELHGQFGGPCIIHDNRLLELYAIWHGREGLRSRAERVLARPVGLDELNGWLAAPDTLPTLFLEDVLAQAHPGIVHSRELVGHVHRLHGATVVPLPFCTYRSFTPESLSHEQRRAARSRLGIPDEEIMLVSLGIVTAAKKPQALVDAVNLLRERGLPVRLHFVGDPRGWRGPLLARAGDPGWISFSSGWIDEITYRSHLQAADYAIQLRTDRLSGISGALMDCIAAGLTTVVSANLADAIDSPSFVLRVNDALRPREIAAALRDAIGRGAHLARHDAERQAYAVAHSFDTYARRLLEVIGIAGPRRLVDQAAFGWGPGTVEGSGSVDDAATVLRGPRGRRRIGESRTYG